jgi:16S rRNA (guanine1207-N2)-methyltransferase
MVPAAASPALEAVFVPFHQHALAMPKGQRALFSRARAGVWQSDFSALDWTCEQSFKPFADELERSGTRVSDVADGETFPLIVLLPPRQRDEARAAFVHALRRREAGGIVVAAVANSEGARSAEDDLRRLAGSVNVLSKHKCRVVWTEPGAPIDETLSEQWAALDTPRAIVDGRYTSRPGLFAWDRIDPASALLAAQWPETLSGRAADLGAGYGFLSCELLRRCAGVTAIDAYEAEARALDLALDNLSRALRERASEAPAEVIWHDVTRGLSRRYDVIVSNPPFHQGRADLPDLGRAFIAAAASALEPHGVFWLVANRHLPYEALLGARFASVRERAVGGGFKVYEASRPRA